MIRTLLVANRGEIARRVFRTCRDLGIATVAVHSDADESAAHVREADAAVRLSGDSPADTYLRGDLIVKAALASGADAVHPGYGFLAENPEFARSVTDAGLTWIGPPPDAIEAMASKTRAKQLMGGRLLDPDRITAADLPVLVKAAAGGGGRGMRIVRDLDELPGQLAAASTEAASSFGDGEVFVEPYLEHARHVEVQLLADAHGTVWALGTRDCSLQRRHQKVIEEAPAPGLPDRLVRELQDRAVTAARAVGYVSAGTVEYLVAPDGRAHFLEMNTRLQVEHPVTEAVHGIDLVALQLRIAEGEKLPSEPPAADGHAVEARLYAEDPANSWQPQTGVLHRLQVPAAGGEANGSSAGSGRLRVDSGVTEGSAITPHYDPMLAKVIAHAPTRSEAVRLLAHALERARIHGPVTNRDLLVRSLTSAEFVAARIDTGFYERHLGQLTAPAAHAAPTAQDPQRLAALACALSDTAAHTRTLPGRIGGWRNVPSLPQVKRYVIEPVGTEVEIRYRLTRDGLDADGFPGVRLHRAAPGRVTLDVHGVRRDFEIARYRDRIHVDSSGLGAHALTALPRFTDPTARTEPGSLLAPMPGTVVRVADGLAPGAAVIEGQVLLWLEAMKMEHKIVAPASGTLTALHAAPGRQVELGALLAVVTDEPRPQQVPQP
ncbi:ATP-grasp domain-containing protein [Streptomyces sp. RB6PN25]|uniref:ATP-grasp domain-containing protein n=1 Tax=Streptomyces humicola TaxID=2953240 RepID=A0ABT1Q7I1_9ACTN|nr:biotin carboxylase N-terminal domain-containing protein [Streptomyces humicola]MCQ4084727.1 ATP-grasp domain-containing protein [Streptomyces humicola]